MVKYFSTNSCGDVEIQLHELQLLISVLDGDEEPE
jgi:hypothetical protein